MTGAITPHTFGRLVRRDDLGAAWPLTVESGFLHPYAGVVVFEYGGRFYALNGWAAGQPGLFPITPLWALDEDALRHMAHVEIPDDYDPAQDPAPHKDLAPLIRLALDS